MHGAKSIDPLEPEKIERTKAALARVEAEKQKRISSAAQFSKGNDVLVPLKGRHVPAKVEFIDKKTGNVRVRFSNGTEDIFSPTVIQVRP
jgi:hypothetical protein